MRELSRSGAEPGRVADAKLALRPVPHLAVSNDGGRASPALLLRRTVAEEWPRASTDMDRRWSPRAALLLSGGASLLLWGAIAWAVVAVL